MTTNINKHLTESRKCMICNNQIKECMGFVLARDIGKKNPRELCEMCAWLINPKDIKINT